MTDPAKPDAAQAPSTGFSLARGISWEGLADGQLHRLNRGVDYRGDDEAARQAAEQAAIEIKRSVRVLREPMGRHTYLWLQFYDGDILTGEACPQCGCAELVRVHQLYVECPSCRSLLLVADLPEDDVEDEALDDDEDDDIDDEVDVAPVPAPSEPAPEPKEIRKPKGTLGTRLDDYSDVRLEFWKRTPGKEGFRGFGVDSNGAGYLLVVLYRLDALGFRVPDPAHPGDDLYKLRAIPAEPFEDFLDLDQISEA
jgi:hypothetical protein